MRNKAFGLPVRLLTAVLAAALLLSFGCKKIEPVSGESVEPPERTVPESPDDAPTDRYDVKTAARTGNNASKTLVLGVGDITGCFSPFYAEGDGDRQAVSLTQLPLLYHDADGLPTAGRDEPCLAYSFECELAKNGLSAVYTVTLKRGVTFSDGTPVTAKDVLFSIYVLCDALYNGPESIGKLDIKGLEEYIFQTDAATLGAADKYIEESMTAIIEGTMTDGQSQEFLSYLERAGELLCRDITDSVYRELSEYIEHYMPGYTVKNVGSDESLKTAFAMAVKGYAVINGNAMIDTLGNTYTLGTDKADAAVFWQNIYEYHGQELLPDAIDSESEGRGIKECIKEVYIKDNKKSKVISISGIASGTRECSDGEEREYVEITTNGTPAIDGELGFFVAPMEYYTREYNGSLGEYGVAAGDSAFFEYLRSRDDAPMGAGPYVFEGYADGTVSYKANDAFIMGSPKIASVSCTAFSGESAVGAVKAGTAHFASVPASENAIKSIEDAEGTEYRLFDSGSRGYIGINARTIPELEVRQAIAYSVDPETALQSLGRAADASARAVSGAGLAYDDEAKRLYPYDASGEKQKTLFLAAGYEYDAEQNIMKYPEGSDKAGGQVTLTLTLPSPIDAHPAGKVLNGIKDVLAKTGVLVRISTDEDMLEKLSDAYGAGLSAWAAAIKSEGIKSDMRRLTADSESIEPGVGIGWLYENGTDAQKKTLVALTDLIEQAEAAIDTDERKELYEEAAELWTGLALEIPLYNKKDMYIFDGSVLDASTLTDGATAFISPVSCIWNVEFAG